MRWAPCDTAEGRRRGESSPARLFCHPVMSRGVEAIEVTRRGAFETRSAASSPAQAHMTLARLFVCRFLGSLPVSMPVACTRVAFSRGAHFPWPPRWPCASAAVAALMLAERACRAPRRLPLWLRRVPLRQLECWPTWSLHHQQRWRQKCSRGGYLGQQSQPGRQPYEAAARAQL